MKNWFIVLGFLVGATRASAQSEHGWDFQPLTRMSADKKNGVMTLSEICRHARQSAPQKKLAMIIAKTHACDRELPGTCLRVLRDAALQENAFIKRNFALYHHWGTEDPVHPDFARSWGRFGIGYILINIPECEIYGSVVPEDFDGKANFRLEIEALEAAIRDQIPAPMVQELSAAEKIIYEQFKDSQSPADYFSHLTSLKECELFAAQQAAAAQRDAK